MTEIECPHCKGDITLKPKGTKTVEIELPGNVSSTGQQTQQIPGNPGEKKLNHAEMAELLPKGVNYSPCPGNDCGHQKLKNPNQTKEFKVCESCNHNGVPKDQEICPGCGKEVSKDADESDINLGEE